MECHFFKWRTNWFSSRINACVLFILAHTIRSVFHTFFKQAKGNPNQLCFLMQKMPYTAQDYESFQSFLDQNQYTQKGILRYERIFGKTFVSTGGAETTEVSYCVACVIAGVMCWLFIVVVLGILSKTGPSTWSEGSRCRLRNGGFCLLHGQEIRSRSERNWSVNKYGHSCLRKSSGMWTRSAKEGNSGVWKKSA